MLISAAVRRRQPLPDVVASAPQLLDGLAFYYEAFEELSTCRGLGATVPGPIPWSAIDRYGDRLGLSGDAFHYLLRMVRALDDAFREWALKEAKSKEDKGDGGPGGVQQQD